MRTTLDLTDGAYYIAKTVARETGESLGLTVSKFITQNSAAPRKLEHSNGLPVFRCIRRVTSTDVRALDDEQ
ncbi:MAG TPA: hypothetical protein VFA65_15345 [Bryobacteraceae bacterium]|nr:hypothetical protein [Bryobacteraceae bacterium]